MAVTKIIVDIIMEGKGLEICDAQYPWLQGFFFKYVESMVSENNLFTYWEKARING